MFRRKGTQCNRCLCGGGILILIIHIWYCCFSPVAISVLLFLGEIICDTTLQIDAGGFTKNIVSSYGVFFGREVMGGPGNVLGS